MAEVSIVVGTMLSLNWCWNIPLSGSGLLFTFSISVLERIASRNRILLVMFLMLFLVMLFLFDINLSGLSKGRFLIDLGTLS